MTPPSFRARHKAARHEKDRDLIRRGLRAMLANEREGVVAFAHRCVNVAGVAFSGNYDQLEKLHQNIPGGIPAVAAIKDLEREVDAMLARLERFGLPPDKEWSKT